MGISGESALCMIGVSLAFAVGIVLIGLVRARIRDNFSTTQTIGYKRTDRV